MIKARIALCGDSYDLVWPRVATALKRKATINSAVLNINVTHFSSSVSPTFAPKPMGLFEFITVVARVQRHIVVLSDPLQYQEGCRPFADVPYQVRSPNLHGISFAGPKIDRFLRILKVHADATGQYVERILNVMVIVPGNNLRRRDLQFTYAEAVTLGMPRTTFDLVELTRIGIRLHCRSSYVTVDRAATFLGQLSQRSDQQSLTRKPDQPVQVFEKRII